MAEIDPKEASRQIRERLERGDLAEIEARLAELGRSEEVPTALSLGLRLAVAMAAEMRDGVPVGSRSGAMVAAWAKNWPQTADDAVVVAREFLLNPGKLKETLASRLFGDRAGSSGEAKP